MARKSKYSPEISDRIVEYISLGYTLKDAAYSVGVSDETIRRWRDKHSDFNRRIVEASNQQWEHPEVLIKSRVPNYRAYRRAKTRLNEDYGPKSPDIHTETQKPLRTALKPAKRQLFYGLPVRPKAPEEWQETPPYFNLSTQRVESIIFYPPTQNLILNSCRIETYLKKRQEKYQRLTQPFICAVF